MLKGRLGLATAQVPHADRHGMLWLGRGRLVVEDGTLKFVTAGGAEFREGAYSIPYQMVSCIVLEPGTTVSHDALRLLASHGTGLVAAGEGGVRFYASVVPHGPDDSARARRQVELWADREARTLVARRMYAWRLGEVFPDAQIEVLRGLEGARAKEMYARLADEHGVRWRGRRYDRKSPERDDEPNQAINHAAAAVVAAAQIAVASAGAIPQLGFIHEASGIALCLDVADLFRDEITVPAAFAGVRYRTRHPGTDLERAVRHITGRGLRKKQVVARMIDRLKDLLDPARAEGG